MSIRLQLRAVDRSSQPAEQLRRFVERLAFQANRAAKASTPDAVHDLRVSIRRLEQALIAFKVYLPGKPVKRIRKELKSVLSAAGALRDCHVAAKILLKTKQPGAAALHRAVQVRRNDAEKTLLLRLKRLSLRTRASRWCDDLQLSSPPAAFRSEMLPALAISTLPRLTQRFFHKGADAAAHRSGERLHDFRILAKKFRYTLELFVPVYGPIAEAWIGEIRSVQSLLGAINDYRTVLSTAHEIGCDAQLQESLKRAERRRIRQFRELWNERFSRYMAARWIRALRTAAEDQVARKPIGRSTATVSKAAAAHA